MTRLETDRLESWNAALVEAREDGDVTADLVVEAAWCDDWVAYCTDRRCRQRHLFGTLVCAVRRYGSAWPTACVGLRQDQEEVFFDLTKPQLAAYIADLTALLDELP